MDLYKGIKFPCFAASLNLDEWSDNDGGEMEHLTAGRAPTELQERRGRGEKSERRGKAKVSISYSDTSTDKNSFSAAAQPAPRRSASK